MGLYKVFKAYKGALRGCVGVLLAFHGFYEGSGSTTYGGFIRPSRGAMKFSRATCIMGFGL